MAGQTTALRSRQGMPVSPASTCPSSTTWLCVLPSGLSSSGFICTVGTVRAASAWKYCALPISPPATTRALLLMFCALNGATRKPWRAYQRHSAVVSQLLPALLVVPSTMMQWAVTGQSMRSMRSVQSIHCMQMRCSCATPSVSAAGPG